MTSCIYLRTSAFILPFREEGARLREGGSVAGGGASPSELPEGFSKKLAVKYMVKQAVILMIFEVKNRPFYHSSRNY